MSLARNLFYTQDKFTIFRPTQGARGPVSYDLIGTFNCTWTDKPNEVKNDNGTKLTPNLSIFAKTSAAERGDRVAIGTHTEMPDSAREVKMIRSDKPLLGTTDYNIYAD